MWKEHKWTNYTQDMEFFNTKIVVIAMQNNFINPEISTYVQDCQQLNVC